MGALGGQWKQVIYKNASEVVRSCKFKKNNKNKPVVTNFTINIDARMATVEPSHNTFDKWIKVKLPFIKEGYKQFRIDLLIPIKEHKHSLKYQNWKVSNTIKLSKNYISLSFEKLDPDIKTTGKIIGIDSGYKNLLVTSENQFIGKEFYKIYEKIARKKQGSNSFKRALKERDNEVNRLVNKELNLSNVKEVKVEDLKNLKKGIKGRFRKSFNSKLQRWTYGRVLGKLERFCEEEAVQFSKVPPFYTSQTCPKCQFRHKNNRKGELFKCLSCGYVEHADYVGACNILRQDPIVPVTQRGNKCL
jgi:IS605 OrfB family transposase